MGISARVRARRLWLRSLIAATALCLVGSMLTLRHVPREILQQRAHSLPAPLDEEVAALLETPIERVEIKSSVVRKIVKAAHAQEGDEYDASYRRISYPNGDVPKGRGACTDVVVRSLRSAGFDLQSLVHKDMTGNFGRYSNLWKLGRTDSNIDHRRVPNLMVYFKRHGQSLPLETSGKDLVTWQPGDIACWKLEDGRWHTGVVSDGIGSRGLPLVVHNGWVCVEQDCLDAWPVVGHFRFPRQENT